MLMCPGMSVSSRGAQRAVAIQMDCFVAPLLAMTFYIRGLRYDFSVCSVCFVVSYLWLVWSVKNSRNNPVGCLAEWCVVSSSRMSLRRTP